MNEKAPRERRGSVRFMLKGNRKDAAPMNSLVA